MLDSSIIGIKITGDASGLEQTLKGAGTDVDRFGARIKDSGDATQQLANGLKSAFIGSSVAVGIIGLKNTIGEFTGAMVAAQIQVDKLRNGLNFAVGRANSAAELDFIRNSAKQLGLEFVTTAEQYTKLAAASRGTSLEGEKTREIFQAIAQASTVMGLSAQETQGALLAVTQMISKGKVQAEELRGQLGERLPGAFQVAARAMGVTTGELDKMLETGQVLSTDFLPKFARQLSMEVAPEVEAASKSMQASVNRLSSAWTEFKQSITSSGVSKVIADEASGIANYVTVVGEAIARAKASGSGLVGSLSAGLGTVIARAPLDVLAGSANLLNSALNTASLGALNLRTNISLLPQAFETNEQKAALLSGRLQDAEKDLAALQIRLAANPANIYLKDQAYQAFLLVEQLRKAKEVIGSAGYVSGDDLKVRHAAAEAEAKRTRETALKSAMTTYATDQEKLNAEIKKQKDALGDLYTPELEARIRKHFIKPVSDSANAFADQQEAAKEWAKFYEDFVKRRDQAEAKSLGLSDSQSELLKFLQSRGYSEMSESARQLNLQTIYTAISQEQLNEEIAVTIKESEQVKKAYENLVQSQEKSASGAEDRLRKQLEQNDSIGLSVEALGELEAANLRTHAAELDRNANLTEIIYKDRKAADAMRDEADALRELADAKMTGAQKKAAHEASKAALDEWQKASEKISDTITDALMRGFESGKGFVENFRDSVVNIFKTMVLRPVVQAVVGGTLGLSGASASATGSGGGGSGSSALSGIKNLYDTAMGSSSWFTDFGGSVTNGLYDMGGALTKAGFDSAGSWLTDATSSLSKNIFELSGGTANLSSTISAVGDGLGYLNSAMAASEGKWGEAIGSALGTYFGGPLGSAIGGEIGKWVDNAFSGGHEYTTGTGISGTFSSAGFNGRNYQDWRNDGSSGFFGIGASGSSSGTNYSAMDASTSNSIGSAFLTVQAEVAGFAEELGLSSDTILGFSKDIRLALTDDAEANKKAIEALLTGIADDLAKTVLDTQYIRESETAADTLARLATNLSSVNEVFDTLGKSTLTISQSSGDSASQLVDLLGGLDKFNSSTLSYYQNFYTETERNAKSAEQLSTAFDALGLTLPDTLEAYRELVNAQDITTEAGRSTYAALITLSGAFATVSNAASDAAKSLLKSLNFSTYAEYAAANAAAGATPLPRFASGGYHYGGARLVGENGPEVEVTGPSRILNSSQMQAMFSGGGSDASAAELQALRQEQRAQAAALTLLTNKMFKLFDDWDAYGMPEVRTVTA